MDVDEAPDGLLPPVVELALITAAIIAGVATAVFVLLAIWGSDPRWGTTALISGVLGFLALMGLVISSPPVRS